MPVLILLAIAWGAFLLPPLLRGRSSVRPGNSVSSFKRDLAVLGRAAPGAPMVPLAGRDRLPGTPAGRSAARRRRRDVLAVLVGAAVFSLLLALAFGGMLVLLHLAVDAALAGYVYLLVQMRKDAERSVRLPYLAPAPAPSGPSLVTVRRRVG